jgi:hypothetical protein
MAGVASEVLLLRGHTTQYVDLQKRMAAWEAELVDAVRWLNEKNEKTILDPHFLPGDRVASMGGRSLQGLPPADASELLSRWLLEFKPGREMQMFGVVRGEQRLDLYVHLPETFAALEAVAKEAPAAGRGTAGEPTANLSLDTIPSAVNAVRPIPAASLDDVKVRLAALPAQYLEALPSEERQRLKKLMDAKAGTDDDRAFLEVRIRSEVLPLFEKEAGQLRARKAELDVKVKDSTARDVIRFKKTSREPLECTIVKENDVQYTVKYGSVTGPILKEDVERVDRGAGSGALFPAELKKSGGAMPGLAVLLDWCQGRKLKVETEYVATWILTLQPLHEPSRRALNLRLPTIRAGTPVAPPVAPMGGPGAAAQSVVQRIELAAVDVIARFTDLQAVIRQMHMTGVGHVYPTPITVPPVAQKPYSIIGNPLTFRFESLPAAQALELGQWWAPLSATERVEFARFYGLWVASSRR